MQQITWLWTTPAALLATGVMLNCASGAAPDDLGTSGATTTTATHGAAHTSTGSSSAGGPGSTTSGDSTTGGNAGPGRELGGVCYAICGGSMSTEGTGWGWENEETCLVQG